MGLGLQTFHSSCGPFARACMQAFNAAHIHTGRQQSCPNPEAFKESLGVAFADIRRMSDGEPASAAWSSTSFKNSADALGSVLELVRQHKVGVAV